jgi:hypothetical protein
MVSTLDQIDKITNEKNNGLNNTKRRIVSIDSIIKANDGTYIFVGTSKLHGIVRDNSSKTNRIRRQSKHTSNE